MDDILITDRAQQEYESIWEWYYSKDAQAAVGFEEAFAKGLQAICIQPLSFVRCDPIHRVYLLDRYPYKVIYRNYEDRIVIVSVFHASREPDTWKER